jgi:hypothetical protein
VRRRLPIPASREFDRFAGGAQFRDRIGIVVQRTRWTTARATVAEKLQPLPGDNLIARPLASLTHAITIQRTAQDVWPWLAQMGAGSRAGWYSYDLLDNGRQRSEQRIVPELQHLTPGMIFPALPGVTDCFTLVAFVLNEVTSGSCRLIVRAREGAGYHFHALPRWLTSRIGPVVHFFMQRKQLLGIKRRAESTPARTLVPTDHSRTAEEDASVIGNSEGRRVATGEEPCL